MNRRASRWDGSRYASRMRRAVTASRIRRVGVEIVGSDVAGVGGVDILGGGGDVDVRGDGGAALVGVERSQRLHRVGIRSRSSASKYPGASSRDAPGIVQIAQVRRDVVAEAALAARARVDEEDGRGEMVVHAQGFDQPARGVADVVTRGERGGAVRRAGQGRSARAPRWTRTPQRPPSPRGGTTRRTTTGTTDHPGGGCLELASVSNTEPSSRSAFRLRPYRMPGRGARPRSSRRAPRICQHPPGNDAHVVSCPQAWG